MAKMWIQMFNLIFERKFAVVIIDPQVKKKMDMPDSKQFL